MILFNIIYTFYTEIWIATYCERKEYIGYAYEFIKSYLLSGSVGMFVFDEFVTL